MTLRDLIQYAKLRWSIWLVRRAGQRLSRDNARLRREIADLEARRGH